MYLSLCLHTHAHTYIQTLTPATHTYLRTWHSCSEWYDRQSIMWCEEGVVISGLLMGLNAIDYNVHMKGEDFDKSVS